VGYFPAAQHVGIIEINRFILGLRDRNLRKIVIGIPRDSRVLPGIEHLANINSLRLIHKLTVDEHGYAAIWQMRPKSAIPTEGWTPSIEGIRRVEILSRSSDGSCLMYIEGEFRLGLLRFFENVTGGYPTFELTPESMKITFLGSKKGIMSFIAQLDRTNVPYRILSTGNANFSRENVLDELTARQRNALTEAHSTGYFDVPRRITSDSLANRLGIDKSTLSEHLRKAERRIIGDLLS
jgi:hypothetical protein